MFNDFLRTNINNGPYKDYIPALVDHGFGQVEPNHLSAQRTSQVYAQLPADPGIEVLQQGQFVKYDYANGKVNFEGRGEWMLVYNEIKLYRDFQDDCEFAMIKDNYQARIYSPFGGSKGNTTVGINGVDDKGNDHYDFSVPATYKVATTYDATATYYTKSGETYTKATVADADAFTAGTFYIVDAEAVPGKAYRFDDVTAAPDMYEMHYNEDPYQIYGLSQELRMPENTTMVPRVLKTNVGDIFTTNTVDVALKDLRTGANATLLTPTVPANGIVVPTNGVKPGILKVATGNEDMLWQVVKIYTMPDHQPGVKIMRVQ